MIPSTNTSEPLTRKLGDKLPTVAVMGSSCGAATLDPQATRRRPAGDPQAPTFWVFARLHSVLPGSACLPL